MIEPIQEKHYGILVWTHKTMDNLRKAECLCLNCSNLANCAEADKLLAICKDSDLAMCITRCKNWKAK